MILCKYSHEILTGAPPAWSAESRAILPPPGRGGLLREHNAAIDYDEGRCCREESARRCWGPKPPQKLEESH